MVFVTISKIPILINNMGTPYGYELPKPGMLLERLTDRNENGHLARAPRKCRIYSVVLYIFIIFT